MAEIPGYWRDPNTGKYFKVGPGFSPPKLGFGQPKTLSELHPIKSYPDSFHKTVYCRQGIEILILKMANGDMGFYLLWAWVAVLVFVGVGFGTARRMRLSF